MYCHGPNLKGPQNLSFTGRLNVTCSLFGASFTRGSTVAQIECKTACTRHYCLLNLQKQYIK